MDVEKPQLPNLNHDLDGMETQGPDGLKRNHMEPPSGQEGLLDSRLIGRCEDLGWQLSVWNFLPISKLTSEY